MLKENDGSTCQSNIELKISVNPVILKIINPGLASAFTAIANIYALGLDIGICTGVISNSRAKFLKDGIYCEIFHN